MATTTAKRTSVTLTGLLCLSALAAPVVMAGDGSAPCRVRNVTQDTSGRSFSSMVGSVSTAAHREDSPQTAYGGSWRPPWASTTG